MDFDKSRVYTALNADELKVGSKVLVADDLYHLKEKVESGYEAIRLKEVSGDNCSYRFVTEDAEFALAYLISEPEEKILKWTDLKLLDKVVNKKTGRRGIVTDIDPSDDTYHIAFGISWIDINELAEWEKED